MASPECCHHWLLLFSYIQVPDTHSLFTFSSQFLSVSYSHCSHVLTPSNSLAQEPSTFLLSSSSLCLCLLVFLIHLRLHRTVFLPHLPISMVPFFLHLPVWQNPLQINTSANCLVLISQMLITVGEKQFHRVEQFGTIIIVGNMYWGLNLPGSIQSVLHRLSHPASYIMLARCPEFLSSNLWSSFASDNFLQLREDRSHLVGTQCTSSVPP